MTEKMTIQQAFEKGRQTGRGEHFNPSPETRERLTALETNQNNFMQQNSKEHDEIKQMISEMKNDLKNALETKADKWTEKALIWGGITIITALIASLAFLIKYTLYK